MNNLEEYSGGCHCGALRIVFSTRKDPATLPLHACQCSFCRKHGARSVADPEGLLSLKLVEPEQVNRYRFGLQTADFYLCNRCGVYVAAVSRSDPGTAMAIVSALDDRDAFTMPAEPATYDQESADDRRARRAHSWTPARVETR